MINKQIFFSAVLYDFVVYILIKQFGGMQGQLINQFMAQKAGMSEVDKRAIAQKIERLTAGTPKSLHQKEMQEKRSLQVVDMLNKYFNYSFEQKEQMKKNCQKEINQMRRDRVLNRYWAHFDFDMFYVACQLLDKPELRDKPCAVGGKNSVLSTANYEARKYGLRAAMPTFIALQLCPQVVLLQHNFRKYKHYSGIFRQILETYDPQVESHGLDEAYVDFTSHLTGKSSKEIEEFIQQIRQQIFEKTGLTVSCGVGANKILAKMASQERKPNNQFVLENTEKAIESFMADKKIRKIPGIGPVNEFYLKGLGIETAKDILSNVDVLTICFSRLSTQHFISVALGVGSTDHEFKERKSLGKSETFKVTDDMTFLEERLKDLCQQVAMQLQQQGFMSINVIFTYQTHNFVKRDKSFNLMKYTDKQSYLFDALITFLKSNKMKLRLLGVKCSSLIKTEDYRKQQLVQYLNSPKKAEQGMEDEKNSIGHIKTLMRNDVVEKGRYMCPICTQLVDCKGNIALFNRHVDQCLTKSDPKNNMENEKDVSCRSVSSKSTKKSKQSKQIQSETLKQFLKKT